MSDAWIHKAIGSEKLIGKKQRFLKRKISFESPHFVSPTFLSERYADLTLGNSSYLALLVCRT